MSLSSWTHGIADPSRLVTLTVMSKASDEQGGGWLATGPSFEAVEAKLSANQAFAMGQEVIGVIYRFMAEMPLSLSEHNRVWHPRLGEMEVAQVLPVPEEGVVVFDATDVQTSAET